MPKAVFNAVVMSLADFEGSASTNLRNSLIAVQGADITELYHSFIVSCYLISLIKEPGVIEQVDLDMIVFLRGTFDSTNLWLEALLVKRLTAPNS